jgi:DNA polymerase-1
LTGDRDTLQLVLDNKVIVRILKKGVSETEDYNEEMVLEKFGISPQKLIDFKALVGDPSDNIGGIPGIGPQTAKDLLNKYGSIEKLYKNLNALPSKIKEKLEKYKNDLLLAQRLVTLQKDININANLEDLKINLNKEELINYFQELGFKSLILRLEKYLSIENLKDKASKKGSKKTLNIESKNPKQISLF